MNHVGRPFSNLHLCYLLHVSHRFPHRMDVVNELKQQVVDVHLCLSAISLTMCRLKDICKEVLHYFPDLFYVVCAYSP